MSDDHMLPFMEHRKGKNYYKFLNTYGHMTNNCVHLWKLLRMQLSRVGPSLKKNK